MCPWIVAINNGHFHTWPGLTADALKKYFPEPTAMVKRHMKKNPKGIQSKHLSLKK